MKNPFRKLPKRPEPGPRRKGNVVNPKTQPNRVLDVNETPVPGISPERRESLKKAWDDIEKGKAP